MDKKKHLHNVAKVNYVLHKAAHESSYKKELLKNPKEMLAKEGIDIGDKKLTCHENTERDFYIVVPTKPLEEKKKLSTLSTNATLDQITRFIVTQVQMNGPLKSKLLKAAHEVLKEQGVKLPQNLKIHVHESTSNEWYLVIPRAPIDGAELNELEMQAFAGGGMSQPATQVEDLSGLGKLGRC